MGIDKALITGATRGIGRELALLLAKQGYELLLVGRDVAGLAEVQKETGGRVIQADLATKEGVEKVCDVIREEVPTLVVNNAGIGHYGPCCEQVGADQIIQLNCQALVTLSQCFAQVALLHKQKATILNISSVLAFFEAPYAAVYAATKRFVLDFSLAFDAEVRKDGIRVLCACPGQVATHFQVVASYGKMKEQVPKGFVLAPATVALALWHQIQKEKAVSIIDWRYSLLVSLTRLIPKKILRSLLCVIYQERT